MKNKSILAKAKMIGSILTVVVCMLIGCERKQEIYLSRPDVSSKEDVLQQETENRETVLAEAANMQQESTSSEIEQSYIVVHICGAVVNPGVYELPEGSRLYQAVEKAGGFITEAAQDYLNQAEIIADGMKLYIPTEEEVLAAKQEGRTPDYFTEGETVQDSLSGLVNINTATEEELCTLTGIGSGKAKSIIDYRTKNGRYEKIEDIMKVEGIKDGLFQKIKDSITV